MSPDPELPTNVALCRELIQRLSALEEDRARVLRHLSHELKTPLAVLREGVALLQEGTLGALTTEQGEVVRILQHNLSSLQRRIEGLLDYHATMSDFSRPQCRRVAVRELLDAVVADHQLQAQSRALRLSVVCDLDSVLLDPDKMRVALSNLLSNAIDFSPHGGEIRLAAMRSGENASCLWFDCIDQGAGVADSEIEQIFDPFVQGSRRRTGGDRGSGIGLSLVREAALAQGGRAFVVPAPRGAHFRMEIPNDE